MTTLQLKVKAKLKRQHTNQGRLADELGISASYLSMILAGHRRPSLPVALALAEKLGVHVREFAEVA